MILEKFCQSCSMPMNETDGLYGTEANGTQNKDYCIYCYKDGKFTSNCTMEEMIEFCVPHTPNMTPEEARKMMQECFPELKRWRTLEN